MFIKNDYFYKYYRIIKNARKENRTKNNKYYENHHFIPRSVRPDLKNKKWNQILLTPEEHYICHSLLPEFTTGKNRSKMIYAWNFIKCKNVNSGVGTDPLIIGAKKYGQFKREFSEIHSEYLKGKYSGENNPMYGKRGENNPNYGSRRTEEQKQFMRDNQPDRSGEKNSMFGKHQSEFNKQRIRESNFGMFVAVDKNGNRFRVNVDDPRVLSKELVAESKGRHYTHKNKRIIVACPYCNKQGDISNMKRWHFDNCKWNYQNAEDIDKVIFEEPIWE